ncbi:L,D-transpeptidase [Tianweitania sediminis]|uniref:L,D-transpeptidase n=1 Tax=Tianweitania sediminis TaxID=1502156 RepID=A0A8J7R270_9HYPH|nr:L,D-transpeptidase [Tianweitania sediminis]MBP0438850.1 L,D-transpeptidase [Tianweitania sediminis]
MPHMTRRLFVLSLPAFAAGCVSSAQTTSIKPERPPVPAYYQQMYAAVPGEPYPVAAADLSKIDPQFYRQEVDYFTTEPIGTIVVDTQARFLYLVGQNGRALRYGIGVGKAGLAFEGVARVQYKREWPRWTPTQDMIAREPERYGPLAGGMEPGPTNPLGPRALYLFQNGVDTLYRIHGTTEDWSIGQAVSSGCIRLLNQDIIDLHGRVPNGTRVVVLQAPVSPVA